MYPGEISARFESQDERIEITGRGERTQPPARRVLSDRLPTELLPEARADYHAPAEAAGPGTRASVSADRRQSVISTGVKPPVAWDWARRRSSPRRMSAPTRRYAEYASCIRPARSRLSYCAHVSRQQKTRSEPDCRGYCKLARRVIRLPAARSA
jgi:hypothetical protein